MDSTTSGFTFELGRILAGIVWVLAVIVVAVAVHYLRILVGALLHLATGRTCGHRVYREGWRTPPCDLAPAHRGAHEGWELFRDTRQRVAWTGTSGCYATWNVDAR